MAKCSGITQAGTACKGIPIDGSQWCYVHHPDHAEERRRHGSKGGKRGGRGRPQGETHGIKELLEGLTERVLSGDLQTGPAAVANQLINTRLRAVELERKVRETDELEARIEAIEANMPKVRPTQGGNRWQQQR
jgi:hypothetical protein